MEKPLGQRTNNAQRNMFTACIACDIKDIIHATLIIPNSLFYFVYYVEEMRFKSIAVI